MSPVYNVKFEQKVHHSHSEIIKPSEKEKTIIQNNNGVSFEKKNVLGSANMVDKDVNSIAWEWIQYSSDIFGSV